MFHSSNYAVGRFYSISNDMYNRINAQVMVGCRKLVSRQFSRFAICVGYASIFFSGNTMFDILHEIEQDMNDDFEVVLRCLV